MSCDCESLFHNQLLLKLVESNDDSYSLIHRLVEGNDDDNHSCSMIHRLVESDDNDDQTDGR